MTIFVRQSLWFCFIARVATILFSEKKTKREKKREEQGQGKTDTTFTAMSVLERAGKWRV